MLDLAAGSPPTGGLLSASIVAIVNVGCIHSPSVLIHFAVANAVDIWISRFRIHNLAFRDDVCVPVTPPHSFAIGTASRRLVGSLRFAYALASQPGYVFCT